VVLSKLTCIWLGNSDCFSLCIGAFDNDQWCYLPAYGWAIAIVFDNDSSVLVCYIGLGIRETACVRNLAIAIVFFFGNDSVLAWGILGAIVVWLCFR
jgi:hypothetical protein